MRRNVLLTVALVAVLALAGCTGGTGPASDGPTTTTTTSAATYAPGVNATGVTSAATLSNAYSESLQNASFTVSKVYNATYANGTAYAKTSLSGRVDSPSAYDLSTAQSGSSLTATAVQYYSPDGNATVLTQTTVGTNTTVAADSATAEKRFGKLHVIDNDFLYLTLASADQTSASLENGTTNLTASGFTVTTQYGLENATDTHATAVVESDGTVDSLTVTYTATANGQPVHVTRTWTYQTGSVSLEQPAWAN